MAIISTRTATRIRLADAKNKGLYTFSGLSPDLTPEGAEDFSGGVAILAGVSVGFTYLITEASLAEEE